MLRPDGTPPNYAAAFSEIVESLKPLSDPHWLWAIAHPTPAQPRPLQRLLGEFTPTGLFVRLQQAYLLNKTLVRERPFVFRLATPEELSAIDARQEPVIELVGLPATTRHSACGPYAPRALAHALGELVDNSLASYFEKTHGCETHPAINLLRLHTRRQNGRPWGSALELEMREQAQNAIHDAVTIAALEHPYVFDRIDPNNPPTLETEPLPTEQPSGELLRYPMAQAAQRIASPSL